MSLRSRLTLWFLVLALTPSLVVSGLVLQQLVSTLEYWDNAGVEDALTSSVAVAKSSLRRLETGLRLAAAPLLELSKSRALDLTPGSPDRMFLERFLSDTGLDLYQIYRQNPADSTWHLVGEVLPPGVLRAKPVDLGPEMDSGRIGPEAPAQSDNTGAFAVIEPLPADSAQGAAGARRVVVGYVLEEDFFRRLSELQLGLGTFRALSVYADVYGAYLRLLVIAILLLVAAIAVIAGRLVARHLSNPIADLVRSFARVDGGTVVQVEPHGAPEVQSLAEAFNAMTGRLAQARVELARAERSAAWQGVARQVAHEIKNPLTTVGLALYNLERDFEALPPDTRAHALAGVASLRRELDALADLAESFAALGALPGVNLGAVDLNAMIESFVQVSPWPHVTIETRLDPKQPLAHGDERQLRRVLRNLVKNGCEAQPSGGRVVVTTRAAAGAAAGAADRVSFEVADEGPGMTAEVVSRVFEPDFSTKGRGSGVGLAVSRRIVEQHGGEIAMDSAPGQGTRVTVTLPERTPNPDDGAGGDSGNRTEATT